MTHRPIILEDINLSFPHKTCFENFSAKIQPGQRIALIGNNGSGKTSLLKMILETVSPEVATGYVPQTINESDRLSGGQRFNKALSEALSQHPDILFLDEPTVVSAAKARQAVETSGRKKKAIRDQKDDVLLQLSELRLPEIIKPKFSLTASDFSSQQAVLMISDGACGYEEPILKNLHLQLNGSERIAITGDNGSGKTTLVRAILGDPKITRSGNWLVPSRQDIGYLDQHYANLNPELSALEEIQAYAPSWTHAEIRRVLNDFLFRKNEEVMTPSKQLSGGEKARLSLAQIAVKTPRLLVLDEITNNLDLATREHVIQVLREYPGAMIVISHDQDFLEAIEPLCSLSCALTTIKPARSASTSAHLKPIQSRFMYCAMRSKISCKVGRPLK